MSEDAILERLNRIEVLIARTHGNRLTRTEMCERLRVSSKTLTERDRLWTFAHPKRHKQPRQEPRCRADGRMGRLIQPFPWNTDWQGSLASLRALDDGLPRNVAGTDAARNSIVPQVAAEVIAAYMETTQ